MFLLPVCAIYETEDPGLIKDFESIVHLVCNTGEVVVSDQDYLEWPLILSTEERLALDDDQYEIYTAITDFFLSELDYNNIPSEDLTVILIQNY